MYVQRQMVEKRQDVCPETDGGEETGCTSRDRWWRRDRMYVLRQMVEKRQDVRPETDGGEETGCTS